MKRTGPANDPRRSAQSAGSQRPDARPDAWPRDRSDARAHDQSDAGANPRPEVVAYPRPDAVIAAAAARQHGVVARRHLVAAGVPAHAVDYRVKTGRLQLLYRGVYRVGPLPTPLEPCMAAVLACGDGAVVSHRSAAVLWGLLGSRTARRLSVRESEAPARKQVEVSITSGQPRPGTAVRVHRVAHLPPEQVTTLESIPVTVPARTLLDLAADLGGRELEHALAEAERRGLASPSQVAALLARSPRRSGAPCLRRLLGRDAQPAFTRSEAESRFISLVRAARPPEPEVNVVVEGLEVDFLWMTEGLVVEVDGFAYHSSRAAFERDHHRDALLAAAGFRVVRVTWRQVTTESEALVSLLTRVLAHQPR